MFYPHFPVMDPTASVYFALPVITLTILDTHNYRCGAASHTRTPGDMVAIKRPLSRSCEKRILEVTFVYGYNTSVIIFNHVAITSRQTDLRSYVVVLRNHSQCLALHGTSLAQETAHVTSEYWR